MSGPLEGLRVFDLTIAMVGPVATKQLGSMGADVIHIESGVQTAGGFVVPPSIKGTSIGYINWNMNKRSIFLDLKQMRDREIAYKLLETSDVFVENMRPGAVDRLGMSYEQVSKINPRIVYVATCGWGKTGPMADVPGADPMVQIFGAWTSVNGDPGGKFESYRHFTQIDFNTGNFIAQAILLGLLARDKTGKGQLIDISMLEGIIALQASRLAEFFATGKTPPLMGSATTTVVPHQAFLCQDKRWVAVGVEKEEQWAPFCKVLHSDNLINDPRFKTNRDRVIHRNELIPMLEETFKTKPVYHWVMELNEVGVPAGKFMDWDEIRFHPQTTENQHVVQVPTNTWGSVYDGGPPYHYSDTPTKVFSTPIPGEHTEEILLEIGMGKSKTSSGPSA